MKVRGVAVQSLDGGVGEVVYGVAAEGLPFTKASLTLIHPTSTERHDVTDESSDHGENYGPGCDSEGDTELDGVDKCPAIREP